jgi:hypothetical protein
MLADGFYTACCRKITPSSSRNHYLKYESDVQDPAKAHLFQPMGY